MFFHWSRFVGRGEGVSSLVCCRRMWPLSFTVVPYVLHPGTAPRLCPPQRNAGKTKRWRMDLCHPPGQHCPTWRSRRLAPMQCRPIWGKALVFILMPRLPPPALRILAEEIPSPAMDPASVCQLVFESLQVCNLTLRVQELAGFLVVTVPYLCRA